MLQKNIKPASGSQYNPRRPVATTARSVFGGLFGRNTSSNLAHAEASIHGGGVGKCPHAFSVFLMSWVSFWVLAWSAFTTVLLIAAVLLIVAGPRCLGAGSMGSTRLLASQLHSMKIMLLGCGLIS